MATFEEIRGLMGDGQMIDLVEAAIVKKAAAILAEATPTAARKQFAQDSLTDPERYSGALWRYLIGANATASADAISRAVGSGNTPDDATIETAVNTAIDALWQ